MSARWVGRGGGGGKRGGMHGEEVVECSVDLFEVGVRVEAVHVFNRHVVKKLVLLLKPANNQ